MKEINDATKQYDNELEAIKYRIKEIQKSGSPVDPKELKALKDHISRVTGELDVMHGNVISNVDAFKNMGSGLKMFGSLFKSLGRGPGAMAEQGAAAAGMAKTLGNMPGLVGKIGGAAKLLGGTLGGVAKIFGGLPGLIIGAAIQLGKMYLEADQWVKDQNKAFATLRGPDIMTGNVKKQFKEFNNEIFNAAKNIQVGLNANQIREFLGAVTQAGTHLDKLQNNVGSYRDTITIAAKASRTLGIDLTQVGGMMGSLVNEYRMNLDKMDKTFNEIAFDAQRAGLNTSVFLGAVEQATTSLTFYGISLEKVSKLAGAFSKTQIMGTQETIQTVKDLTQTFTNMSTTEKAAFLGVVKATEGGTASLIKAAEEKAAAIEAEAKSASPDKRAALMTKAEMARALADGLRAGKSDVEMAPLLQYLSDDTAGILDSLVKANVGDWTNIQGESVLKMEKIFGALHISEKLYMELVAQAKTMTKQFDMSLGLDRKSKEYQGSLIKAINTQGKLSESQLTALETGFNDLSMATDENTRADKTAGLSTLLQQSLKLEETQANDIAEMASLDPVFAKQLQETIKTTGGTPEERGAQIKVLTEIYKNNKLGSKKMTKANSSLLNSQGKIADQAEVTNDDILNQTLSLKEMASIGMDQAKWALKSAVTQDWIGGNVQKILDKMYERGTVGAGTAAAETAVLSKGVKDAIISAGGKFTQGKKEHLKPEEMKKNLGKVQEEFAKTADALKGYYGVKSTATLDDLLSVLSESKESGAAEDMANISGLKNAMDALGNYVKSLQESTTTATSVTGQQGMTIPKTVTVPGPVVLHPGETILPKGYQSIGLRDNKYLMPANAPTPGGGGAAGGSKTFNISASNVSEKALAALIANEVRGILYKEQQTGMA